MLADAYIIAANLMAEVNDDPLALTLADQALQSAQAGNDPLTTTTARRAVAAVLRRTGRRAAAHDLLLPIAAAIEPRGQATPEQLSVTGTLLEAATRIGKEASHRQAYFSSYAGRFGRLHAPGEPHGRSLTSPNATVVALHRAAVQLGGQHR